MAIYVTGDTHGDFGRFSYKRWHEARSLTKDDIVIIAGDCGLLWRNYIDEQEHYWRLWLSRKPWITAYVCGNHENHPRLNALPTAQMYGGTVGIIEKNIIHLKRGEVYEIQGKKIFTFGGANSIDKEGRTIGVSWWPEELPSYKETEYGLTNLEKHQYAVDFIIAHTAPQDVAEALTNTYGSHADDADPTRTYLQHVCDSTAFSGLYCGHWHSDVDFGKHHFLYTRIMRIH
jgi:predicted phosphodiesterase